SSLEVDLARVFAEVEVDDSNRSMGASEGPGSTVETLFDEERPGTLVVLIPYRVQVTSAGSENTGTFDDFDAVHEHRGTRALVRNPVERVVAGAGDVTRPRLFAAGAVLDRQVLRLRRGRGACRRTRHERGPRGHTLSRSTASRPGHA